MRADKGKSDAHCAVNRRLSERVKVLNRSRKIYSNFSSSKVILHVSDRHTPGFVRLLQSGSGRVVARSLPYRGSVEEVTHAIIDPNRIKDLPWSEIENLHKAGIHCCVSEYIGKMDTVFSVYFLNVCNYLESLSKNPAEKSSKFLVLFALIQRLAAHLKVHASDAYCSEISVCFIETLSSLNYITIKQTESSLH